MIDSDSVHRVAECGTARDVYGIAAVTGIPPWKVRKIQDDILTNYPHIVAGHQSTIDPLFGPDVVRDSFEDIFSNYVTDWDERIHPERYVYKIRDCATLGPCARMRSDEPCDCVH